MDIKILFGTETGNSSMLADKAKILLENSGITAEVLDMADVDFEKLKTFENVIIITSTFGDGEPPFNATSLYEELKAKRGSELENTKFAVFALGQTIYEKFAQTGIDFHNFLTANGAKPVAEITKSDDDFDETFEPWLNEIKTKF